MSYRNYEEDQLADERAPIEAAREAVIEAAKAWVTRWASEMDDIVEYVPEARQFKEAVEALQEAGA